MIARRAGFAPILLVIAACDGGGGAPEAVADAAPVPADGARDAALDAVADGALDATAEPAGDAAPDADSDGAPPDGHLPDAMPPPPPPEGLPRFAFPVHPDDRGDIQAAPIFGVDHDPAEGDRAVCTNYAGRGFPFCYDGHDGSDFLLRGGFTTMDRGSARVVAAAGGEVIGAHDGEYDRCHADARTQAVTCDGHPMRSNLVRIRHAHGWESAYFHLKKDSVAVAVGDLVDCGHVLGLIGSSGNSSLPHVHFEVTAPDGRTWDPYAGPASQPETLWAEQERGDGLPGDACDPSWGPG